jgi:cell division transport system ATP-binding protein
MIIQLKNVSVFQGNSQILGDVNLNINNGEFVYLIGKTGFGKSSLLKTLYGDLPLTQGEGNVAGFDLKKLTWKTLPNLRRKLGIVFQDFQLLSDRNVNDNLVFALKSTGWTDKSKIQNRIDEVLNLVGLKTKGFKMSFELSGGEQQRVVIARALLNSPELILADEPTGNLDPETSDEIITLLQQIAKESNTAMLIATHDYLMMKKFPSRTIRCEGGKVIDLDTEQLNHSIQQSHQTVEASKPNIFESTSPTSQNNISNIPPESTL